jgi:hypothetical protein
MRAVLRGRLWPLYHIGWAWGGTLHDAILKARGKIGLHLPERVWDAVTQIARHRLIPFAAGARGRARAHLSIQSFEPPSTWTVSPVIQRASSEARKATTPPTSSGSARRFKACMPSVLLAACIGLGEVRHVGLDDTWSDGIHPDGANSETRSASPKYRRRPWSRRRPSAFRPRRAPQARTAK